MVRIKQLLPVVLMSSMSAACYAGAEQSDVVDEITGMRDVQNNSLKWNDLRWNDLKWNDLKWNDLKWNGLRWNDLKWNGIKWNGILWNGVKWTRSSLDGSQLVVSRKAGGKWEHHRGEELIGMSIDLIVDVRDNNDQPTTANFEIRVEDIFTDEAWDDVYYYNLVIGLKGSDVWEPLCAGGNPAIPLRNYWDETTGVRIDDPDVITFACTSGVLAHCVQWGYRPWAEAERCGKGGCQDISLTDYHQACTRMARADYCGNGTAWTIPGTPIDIYDKLSPPIEASETDWPVEAEWTTEGAYCLQDIRQQGWKAQGQYPVCENKKQSAPRADCGTLKDNRAMMVSKFEKL